MSDLRHSMAKLGFGLIAAFSLTGCTFIDQLPAGPVLFKDSSITGTIVRQGPEVMRKRFVTVNFDLLSEKTQSPSKTLILDLFPDTVYTAQMDKTESGSWIGHLVGINQSDVILTTFWGKVLRGSIQLPGKAYWVEPAGNDLHAIYQRVDESKLPPVLFKDSLIPGTIVREGPEVLRRRFVAVNFELLGGKNKSPTETLTLNLFPDAVYIAQRDEGRLGFSWLGHLEGIEFGSVVLSTGGGTMWGEVRMPGAVYWIRYAGNDVNAIYQVDESVFPHDSSMHDVINLVNENGKPVAR